MKPPIRQYFDDGWRTGYEVASKIDDNGNAHYRIEIIPSYYATKRPDYKPRYRWFKESDTRAVGPVEPVEVAGDTGKPAAAEQKTPESSRRTKLECSLEDLGDEAKRHELAQRMEALEKLLRSK